MTGARDLLEPAARRLEAAGVASPRHDAETLLAYLLGLPRSRVGLGGPDLTPDQERRYDSLITRRAAREPLQHLTGSAPFRYLEILVGPGVFIPRPETEVVAGWAIDVLAELAHESEEPPVAVDLCTGSGAVAASIAGEVPGVRIYAVELDPAAHAWAERNLALTTVTLVHGDAATAFPELDGTVDVVVANPPYIPLEAYESVEQEVRDHDPALALWSGTDGLDAIRMVERSASRLLRPGGLVVVEHADVQGESAPAVFTGTGRWERVRDHLDLAGRNRFVTARRVER